MGVLWDHLLDEFDSREFSSNIFLEIPYDFRTLQKNGRGKLVGVERFELPPHIELPIQFITNKIKYLNSYFLFCLNPLTCDERTKISPKV